MTFVSFAQNFEDVMLRRALQHVTSGFYVDVGAQDPVRDSVTKAFYESGWRGINIEPVQTWFEQLCADRVRDINLNLIAGEIEAGCRLFEVVGSGLSTLDSSIAMGYRQKGYEVLERSVQARPLTSILQELAPADIHFLKVDVEGAEVSVLKGLDLNRFRPWLMIIEARQPNSQEDAYQEWENLVLSGGYNLAWDDGLNRFYCAREHADLMPAFRYPPNVFDDFIRYGSQARIVQAENDRDHLRKWAGELERRVVETEQDAAGQLEGLRSQIASQKADLEMMQAALRRTEAAEVAAKSDRDSVLPWAEGLQAQLAEAGLAMAEQAKVIAEQASLLETARSEREALLGWVEDLRRRLLQAEQAMAVEDSRLEELNARLADMEFDMERERAAGAAKLEETRIEFERLSGEHEHLQRRAAELDRRIAGLLEQIAERDSAIISLHGGIDDAGRRCEELAEHSRGLASAIALKRST